MGVACPCGCGRTIKRDWHRTAEHALFLASLAQVPEHLAKVYSAYDPAEEVRMEAFALKGLGYSHSMLNRVHEVPHTFGLPSAKEVNEWQAAAFRLLHVAKRADPGWFSHWGPGPSGLPSP
jgi:hypothetical protein